jgi:hypothetical protein
LTDEQIRRTACSLPWAASPARRWDRPIRRSQRLDQRTLLERRSLGRHGQANPVASPAPWNAGPIRTTGISSARLAPLSRPCAWLVAGRCAVVGGVHSDTSHASIGVNLEDRWWWLSSAAGRPNIFTRASDEALQLPELLDAEQRLFDAYLALGAPLRGRRQRRSPHTAAVRNSHALAHPPVARFGPRPAPHRSGKDQQDVSSHRVTVWRTRLACSNAFGRDLAKINSDNQGAVVFRPPGRPPPTASGVRPPVARLSHDVARPKR